MKFTLAVHHEPTGSTAAACAFEEWSAAEPEKVYVTRLDPLPVPARGTPDERDAQAVTALVNQHHLVPELVVMDGLVHLDVSETPGPLARVHAALGGGVPVVGVSRAAFKAGPAPSHEVEREDEAPPVLVTAAGLDLGAAKARVRAMHGRKRVPTLLKRVARLAKGGD